MRRFNKDVYKETHDSGATARYTSAEFNDLLGSQDVLVVQYSAVKIAGTTPTLTIDLQGSNNGADWQLIENLINAVSLTPGSVNAGIDASGQNLPAFVRLAIYMGGTNPSAELQIIASGRSTS